MSIACCGRRLLECLTNSGNTRSAQSAAYRARTTWSACAKGPPRCSATHRRSLWSFMALGLTVAISGSGPSCNPFRWALSRVRSNASFWLPEYGWPCFRPSGGKPNNLSVSSSILPLGIFHDVIESIPEPRNLQVSDRPHFSNNGIRLHHRSPTIPAACRSPVAPHSLSDRSFRSVA